MNPPKTWAGVAEAVHDCEEQHENDACGDRRALEIADLPGVRIGKSRGSHVEACQAADPAADEIRQAHHIPKPTQTECVTKNSGSDPEGDDIRERIEVGAEQRLATLIQTGDMAIESVKNKGEDWKNEGGPEFSGLFVGDVSKAQENGDRAATRIGQREDVRQGVGAEHREALGPFVHFWYPDLAAAACFL